MASTSTTYADWAAVTIDVAGAGANLVSVGPPLSGRCDNAQQSASPLRSESMRRPQHPWADG